MSQTENIVSLINYFNPADKILIPSKLKGRDKELDSLNNFIASKDCVIVQGARRIGKSSLLQVIKRQLPSQSSYCVDISFQTISSYNSNAFCDFLINEICFQLSITDSIEGDDLLKRFRLIGQALQLYKSNKLLCVFIDEFQVTEEMTNSERINFYNQLRGLIDVRKQYLELNNILIIMSTSQSIWELQNGLSSTLASAFADRISLAKISPSSCKELIKNPFQNKDILEEEQLNKIIKKIGSHPYLVKLLFRGALRNIQSSSVVDINQQLYDEIIKEYDNISSDLNHQHFRLISDNLSKQDKKVLFIITLNKVNFEAIKSRFDGKIRELKKSLEHLENLQIINFNDPEYSFTSDLYRDWFIQYFEGEDPILLRSESTGAETQSNSQEQPRLLIMKGGGVKGLAYVGAIRELEKFYNFNWYAGTSAGAIAAILLAAGYTVDELEEILNEKNFKEFLDANILKTPINLIVKGGLYKADAFTVWLDQLLAKKLDKTYRIKFKDLPNRVTLFASRRGKRALVFDSKNPSHYDTDAAYAVRCSMSIPIFFTPQKHMGISVFDGGMQNNFPVSEIIRENPNTAFIGLYLGDENFKGLRQMNIFKELFYIWSEATDIDALREHDGKIVVIDPKPISTLDFKLNKDEKEFLITAGTLSSKKFLAKSIQGQPSISSNQRNDLEKLRKKIIQIRNQKKKAKWIKVICAGLIIGLIYCLKLFFF